MSLLGSMSVLSSTATAFLILTLPYFRKVENLPHLGFQTSFILSLCFKPKLLWWFCLAIQNIFTRLCPTFQFMDSYSLICHAVFFPPLLICQFVQLYTVFILSKLVGQLFFYKKIFFLVIFTLK